MWHLYVNEIITEIISINNADDGVWQISDGLTRASRYRQIVHLLLDHHIKWQPSNLFPLIAFKKLNYELEATRLTTRNRKAPYT